MQFIYTEEYLSKLFLVFYHVSYIVATIYNIKFYIYIFLCICRYIRNKRVCQTLDVCTVVVIVV